MLRIENVNYTYETGTRALNSINLELPKEHILAILGESGSGKTTLLQCLARFLKPQSGRITFDGEDINDMEIPKFRKAIGTVFQNLYLFPHLCVLENMTLAPIKVYGKEKKEAEDEAVRTLEKLGIGELKDYYPSQISGGQAQRVAIARALILKPQYLLLDEPTSALDINTTEDFGQWLTDLKEETTFIVVTHDIIFADRVATSGALIDNGEVVMTGKVHDIFEKMDINQ